MLASLRTRIEVNILNEVFLERGPVDEILMDNSATFHSSRLADLLNGWKVNSYFRAAYRASGNCIIERNHRTIKTIAERSNITPQEAVFWYDITPRSHDQHLIPQRELFTYDWRCPLVEPTGNYSAEQASVELGDEVWVKPPNARCTTEWQKGHVTDIISRNNVSVDGMPRHILDLRPVVRPGNDSDEDLSIKCEDQDERNALEEEQLSPRPQRNRRPPVWSIDYEMDS